MVRSPDNVAVIVVSDRRLEYPRVRWILCDPSLRGSAYKGVRSGDELSNHGNSGNSLDDTHRC